MQAPDPAALLAAVRAVAARYPEGYIFGRAHGSTLRLELGDYSLTDYAFHVAGELENVLRHHGATPTTEPLPADTPWLRLAEFHDPTPRYSYGDGLFQSVSSGPRKHQAQTTCLRLDCHLPQGRKAGFLAALDALCGQFALDVLYYFDHPVPPQENLIVFFSNGRQGVGGQSLRYTDAAALKTAVLAALAAHGGHPGCLGEYPTDYPRSEPRVIRVVDTDFVL